MHYFNEIVNIFTTNEILAFFYDFQAGLGKDFDRLEGRNNPTLQKVIGLLWV